MKTLYGLIEPYQQGMLKVSEIHDIYYEQCGNPNGRLGERRGTRSS